MVVNVVNTGSELDKYAMYIGGGSVSLAFSLGGFNEVYVETGEKEGVVIWIDMRYVDIPATTYEVSFTAVSLSAKDIGMDVSASRTFNVSVEEQPVIRDGDGGPEEPWEQAGVLVAGGIIAAIIAVIAAVGLMLYLRRRKAPKEEG